jgi:hypothetical protein
MSEEEKFVVLADAMEKLLDAPEEAGRCRIYDSSNNLIDCENKSSEAKCMEWARYRRAHGYGWAPGWSC